MSKSKEILNTLFEDYMSINKGKLKKMLLSGDFLGRVSHKTTDDYYADATTDYTTNWMPVEVNSGRDDFGDVKNGKLYISDGYFSDKYVYASVNSEKPTIIQLSLHSFKTLELKDKKFTRFYILTDTNDVGELSDVELYVLGVSYGITSMYRPKFYRGVKEVDTIIQGLMDKGLLAKNKSISKKGESLLKSMDRETLRTKIGDFAKSINSYFNIQF